MKDKFNVVKELLEKKNLSTNDIDFIINNIESALKNEVYKFTNRKKFGLLWEEQQEDLIEKYKKYEVALEEIKNKEIFKGEEYENNILIEGDNYFSLLALQKTHKEKIDVIYIDPPYNTGNNDFAYNDNFKGKEDEYRHSKWISFMNLRLNLAKELLADDGVIFISIDDNEQAQLKLLCDEIFGEENFISKIAWINNLKGRILDKNFSEVYELIYVYAKNSGKFKMNKILVEDEKVLKKYNLKDKISKYKKGHDFVNSDSKFNIDTRSNLAYSIYYDKETKKISCKHEIVENSDGKKTIPDVEFDNERYIRIIPPFRKTNNKLGCWRWQIDTLMKNYDTEIIIDFVESKGKLFIKDRLTPDGEKLTKYKNIITNVSSNNGTVELNTILGDKIFNNPKPVELIKTLLSIPKKNSVILDFFAGSGTTGQAVIELNKEDDGNRKFILCTNNENNICENVTYQRLFKVISGYEKYNDGRVQGINANLKYFKINFDNFILKDEIQIEQKKTTQNNLEIIKIRHQVGKEEIINENIVKYKTHSENIILFNKDYFITENDIYMIENNLENNLKNFLYCSKEYFEDELILNFMKKNSCILKNILQ
jgi:adenine-specific DNA-methyltransferase